MPQTTGETRFARHWTRFWMRFSGPGRLQRIPAWLAGLATPPYTGRCRLVRLGPHGYISPSATLAHRDLRLGGKVFIGDRVLIYQGRGGGPVELADRSYLIGDTTVQCGEGAGVTIGSRTTIQPRCQFSACVSSIRIGERVQIAPGCGFYSYDHGMLPDQPIFTQPLTSRGPIVIEDDAWLGYGVVVLSGVRIGKGAVIGAGSVVTRNVPEGAVAMGTPARVVRMRGGSGVGTPDVPALIEVSHGGR